VTLLLTRPFTDEIVVRDDADRWALMQERALREVAWRAQLTAPVIVEMPAAELEQVSLITVVPARDAGDVCHVCGAMVTWTDHLPPLEAGGPVRCFANIEYLPTLGAWEAAGSAAPATRDAVTVPHSESPALAPGERRVGDAIVYSAAFLDTTGPEAV
jgi:hypothetical protein